MLSQNCFKTAIQILINTFRVCQGKYKSGIDLKQHSNHEEKSEKIGKKWQIDEN